MGLVTVMFMVQSFLVINKRSDTNFLSTKLTRYFSDDFHFTEEQGFQMAFAVIDWNSDDGLDDYGRPLEEFLEVELHLEILVDNV